MAKLSQIEKISLCLLQDFADRRRENPKYSLRDFSRMLGVSPSTVSRLFRGQLQLSSRRFIELAEAAALLDTKGYKDRSEEEITEELFLSRIHSHWLCFAILELTHTLDFREDEAWIAKRLGVEFHEVHLIVSLLHEFGYLKVNDDGRWQDCYADLNVSAVTSTTESRRNLVRQRLQLAKDAIEKMDLDQRDGSHLTVAFDPNNLLKFRQLVDKFRSDVNALSKQGEPHEVYHLDIHFFPVTE